MDKEKSTPTFEGQALVFELPPELVAQHPPAQRGTSRLMVLGRHHKAQPTMGHFEDLLHKLPPQSLLVINEVRVSQARLLGIKESAQNQQNPSKPQSPPGQVEAFILEPPSPESLGGTYDLWCLVRPGRRVQVGAKLVFSHPDSSLILTAQVLEVHPDGRRLLRFDFPDQPEKVLDQVGHVPLPFYIKRPDTIRDRESYQTVYSQTPGAVAAPTAGLHFTPELLAKLQSQGISLATITLKVSAGTFAPLTQEQLDSGRLHREEITVPEQTAQAICQAKAAGRPIVAVGTTTVRALEWAALESEKSGCESEGKFLTAQKGWCDLFIRPGYSFRVVDGLITNFHLPGSSLLMLVAAFTGQQNIMNAYEMAVANRFRFYSYGDAMLIV